MPAISEHCSNGTTMAKHSDAKIQVAKSLYLRRYTPLKSRRSLTRLTGGLSIIGRKMVLGGYAQP